MTTADIKNFRGPESKTAQQVGEQSLTAAAETPESTATLHSELVREYLTPPLSGDRIVVATPVGASRMLSPWVAAGAALGALQSAVPAPSLRDEVALKMIYKPNSFWNADGLTYICYIVSILTLARRVTVNHLNIDDVTFPDMKKAQKLELVHRCVFWTSSLTDIVEEKMGNLLRCSVLGLLAFFPK